MSRFTALFGVMTMFWVAVAGLSWLVQGMYLPFARGTIESSFGSVVGAVLTWLIIVVVIVLMLIGFRNLLRLLFWRTIARPSKAP